MRVLFAREWFNAGTPWTDLALADSTVLVVGLGAAGTPPGT